VPSKNAVIHGEESSGNRFHVSKTMVFCQQGKVLIWNKCLICLAQSSQKWMKAKSQLVKAWSYICGQSSYKI